MHPSAIRTVAAHAKINLLLRILAREQSGYHGLETLLQRLALHDTVRVTVNDTGRTLHCAGPAMPPQGLGEPTANLAWRAAVLYAERASWDTGWEIDIEKHIPVGGGLGGGSSDAAAVLKALDSMAPTPLGRAALVEIGGELGADVPFFVSDFALALGWSRGDRLLALPPLPPMAVTLIAFESGIATAEAYGAVARDRQLRTQGGAAHAPRSMAYDPTDFHSWSAIAALAANDFEPAACALHAGVARVLPLVRGLAGQRRDVGEPAIGMLSGSGATCFLLAPTPLDTPALLDVPHTVLHMVLHTVTG